ncbi:hypothetical protein LCGC14_2205870 [marine sediment metagenome]|uniref:Uncharacterized protein n=1 Tax=marine sediment metagenome TaxID=412755 RepID=A0A0F9E2N2_9ZZZZ
MSQSVDMRKELEAAIVDTLDDLDLDFALMSVKVQRLLIRFQGFPYVFPA